MKITKIVIIKKIMKIKKIIKIFKIMKIIKINEDHHRSIVLNIYFKNFFLVAEPMSLANQAQMYNMGASPLNAGSLQMARRMFNPENLEKRYRQLILPSVL